ncbi:MAG: hypothetical protein MI810_08355 [Flavobacteriales bacterium]|nr:hypothetical protein [Flavobacteriales bacterium]
MEKFEIQTYIGLDPETNKDVLFIQIGNPGKKLKKAAPVFTYHKWPSNWKDSNFFHPVSVHVREKETDEQDETDPIVFITSMDKDSASGRLAEVFCILNDSNDNKHLKRKRRTSVLVTSGGGGSSS